MKLKVASLNIEGRKHLTEVKQFLMGENPEIVCLMEVIERDVDKVLADYPYRKFASNFRDEQDNIYGVAIGSKLSWSSEEALYFDFSEPKQLVYAGKGRSHRPVMVKVHIGQYVVGAVHFTWTPDGKDSIEQTDDLERLIARLGGEDMVMCGDFNIPRGNSNYFKLAGKLRDNVPSNIDSTLDPVMHYTNRETPGKLKLVVDYIWSTPKYLVENVRVEDGVSDHCALVLTVTKN